MRIHKQEMGRESFKTLEKLENRKMETSNVLETNLILRESSL
jgi:DNA-binding LacI/PurR family transcriptional regulator